VPTGGGASPAGPAQPSRTTAVPPSPAIRGPPACLLRCLRVLITRRAGCPPDQRRWRGLGDAALYSGPRGSRAAPLQAAAGPMSRCSDRTTQPWATVVERLTARRGASARGCSCAIRGLAVEVTTVTGAAGSRGAGWLSWRAQLRRRWAGRSLEAPRKPREHPVTPMAWPIVAAGAIGALVRAGTARARTLRPPQHPPGGGMRSRGPSAPCPGLGRAPGQRRGRAPRPTRGRGSPVRTAQRRPRAPAVQRWKLGRASPGGAVAAIQRGGIGAARARRVGRRTHPATIAPQQQPPAAPGASAGARERVVNVTARRAGRTGPGCPPAGAARRPGTHPQPAPARPPPPAGRRP